MLDIVLTSFTLVALSEMGDKTQLLAFALAARFKRPLPVIAGIFVATLFNHALAAALGRWVGTQIPTQALAWLLGITFIAFGIWALKPDSLDSEAKRTDAGPFWTTVVLFFLAEIGDKTQLATAALGARFNDTFLVTVGTTLGMLVSDGLAVYLGDKLSGHSSMKWIRWISAALFLALGAISIIRALS